MNNFTQNIDNSQSKEVRTRAKKSIWITLGGIAAIVVIAACTKEAARAKPNFIFKDSTKPNVLAKIGSEEITEDELIGDEKLEFMDLKKREYELRMARLNKLLVDKLVGAEAKKENLPTDEYISKKIVKGDFKIGDKDFKKFVEDKKIPEAQITPQIKERIMSYMKEQKRDELLQSHIAKLTKSTPVEVYFKKPKVQMNVEIGNSPSFGPEKAPVSVVVFSDFQCPFCARGADTVNDIKKKYGSKVRVAFRNFPLPMHREAKPASEAAMCVNEQGSDKFWKFHDLVFKGQDQLTPDKLGEKLEKMAKDAGADPKKFKECYDAKKFAKVVEDDMKYGEKLGIRSTPTFFVNGQLVSGALPIDAFSEIIDEALDEVAVAKK